MKTSLDRVLFVPASEWRARREVGQWRTLCSTGAPTGCVLVCVRVPSGPPCYGAPRPPERVFRSCRCTPLTAAAFLRPRRSPCPFLSAPLGVRSLQLNSRGLERLRTLGAGNYGPGRLRLLCGRAVMSTRASLLREERLRVGGFPGLSKAWVARCVPLLSGTPSFAVSVNFRACTKFRFDGLSRVIRS